MYPTPSQLLTKMFDMLREGNEPGPNGTNPTTLWDEGVTILAVRRGWEYAIRLEAIGIQSTLIFYWSCKDGKAGWRYSQAARLTIEHWLKIIKARERKLTQSKLRV